MANPFVHIELHTDNSERAKEFYGELFDWELSDVPMGEATYTMIKVGDGVGGGMMVDPTPGASSHWLSFVAVEDIASALEKASTLGATVLQEKTPIPGSGFFGVIADPSGAVLGLVEHN